MLNLRFVFRQLGLVMAVISASMLVIGLWAALEWARVSRSELLAMEGMFAGAVVGLIITLATWAIGRTGGESYLGRREALLLVALSWLVGAAVAGLPFFFWAMADGELPDGHVFRSPAACYFEAMSGFTTTGASVLSDVEAVPHALLLWRAMTHWLGGLGIVVLFVAVLPSLGVGGKKLFAAEVTGPTATGVRPRIRETARVLWLIYLGMTLVQSVLLRLCGMTWFDAVCHTFATLATGGFSTRNASIGYYDSWAIDIIVIVFMVLAGVNFGLYYQAMRGRVSAVWRDPELRLYLIVLGLATVIIGFCVHGTPHVPLLSVEPRDASITDAARHAAFQVASIQTTTGFATADFDRWGFVPKAVLIALMFIGGCAGSTGGGIKVIRILIAAKVMAAEIERVFRPSVVRTVRAGRSVIPPEIRQETLVYIGLIVCLFLFGAVALQIIEGTGPEGISFATAATASAATLNNIGPGLHLVGPTQNYGFFSPASHLLMCVLMCLGRLEVYALFVLFLPTFWRGE